MAETIDERAIARRVLTEVDPAAVDPRLLMVSYDGVSDTLLIDLYGPGIPSIGVPLGDGEREWLYARYVGDGEREWLYARYDWRADRIVGFQIPHFLAWVLPRYPALVGFLTRAELRGITHDEVAHLRAELDRRAVAVEGIGHLLGDLAALAAA